MARRCAWTPWFRPCPAPLVEPAAVEALIQIGIALTLLVIGFFVGRRRESAHYASIRQRESQWAAKPAVTMENPASLPAVRGCALACGTAVISVDYYKRFLAGLRTLFGGEMKSYSTLIDRARREAVLRMKESAPEADMYFNIQLQTSAINDGAQKAVAAVEVIAYSTAITFDRGA